MKITPTETIMSYLVTLRMFQSSGSLHFSVTFWVVFGFFLVMTVVYLIMLRAHWGQVVISTLMFAAWVLSNVRTIRLAALVRSGVRCARPFGSQRSGSASIMGANEREGLPLSETPTDAPPPLPDAMNELKKIADELVP
jgi:hypothetical protein